MGHAALPSVPAHFHSQCESTAPIILKYDRRKRGRKPAQEAETAASSRGPGTQVLDITFLNGRMSCYRREKFDEAVKEFEPQQVSIRKKPGHFLGAINPQRPCLPAPRRRQAGLTPAPLFTLVLSRAPISSALPACGGFAQGVATRFGSRRREVRLSRRALTTAPGRLRRANGALVNRGVLTPSR